jgi:hypothetical protein
MRSSSSNENEIRHCVFLSFENGNPILGLPFSFHLEYFKHCGNSLAARARSLRAEFSEYSDNSNFFHQLSEYSENSEYPELSDNSNYSENRK